LNENQQGIEHGGDYPFALKGNRSLMVAEVVGFFTGPAQNLTPYQTVDADHGQIEPRLHRVIQEVDWLFSGRHYKGEPHLPGLAAIACVRPSRQIGETVTTATRYDVSSARQTPKGQRPGKPQYSVKTHPQYSPKSQTKTPRLPKTQTCRMVR
jgi:hypothetical protein